MSNEKNKSQNNLEIRRHSLEHVMVLAVRRLFDDKVLLGVGPVIENGFYQDFDRQFSESDFVRIEEEMKKIIKEDIKVELEYISIDEAIEFFEEKGQKYKVELLKDIKSKGSTKMNQESESEVVSGLLNEGKVSMYSFGAHKDLCRGPHVDSTGELVGMSFKLDRIAGAYWRGDEKNKMLTRIYALAFEAEDDMELFLERREQAKLRDHKKLGKEMELFMFHETSPGAPYWLPRGMAMLNELMRYWRDEHAKRGYDEVSSPLINKSDLYKTSGHWDHYKDSMFIADMGENEVYGLKPMNCPNAMIIFGSRLRSYKELPLRLSDVDRLHRYEQSGELNGLFRVRAFAQDDSHNFISEEMIKDEVREVLSIVDDFYGVFGLKDNVKLYLATRPDDFMGDVKSWDKAEKELSELLEESDFKHGLKDKDGAFYGPKIDIYLSDSLGREWQCGTIQLDFQQPKNFKLEYVDKDGSRRQPVVIHRVVYGSLERFMGILIEHFAGSFPAWVAPVQVRILPINDDVVNYAKDVQTQILNSAFAQGITARVEVDDRSETLQSKIRDAAELKVPYTLIVGNREEEAAKVSVRVRGVGDKGQMSTGDFVLKFIEEISVRKSELTVA